MRQFNGHTQVNAADLRKLRYPSEAKLRALGTAVDANSLTQEDIDGLVALEVGMGGTGGIDPIKVRKRIDEALEVLKALQFPRRRSMNVPR